MSRWVLHIDMDAFYASCEQLTRPTLRGRPVIVGGLGGRGVVAGCSYEARALGIRSAMPIYHAKQLIDYRSVLLPPRFSVYSALSHKVWDLVAQSASTLEQMSVDEAYLEPTELQGVNSEQAEKYVTELKNSIYHHTGLVCSVGAGSGRQIAKIASAYAKPNGIKLVDEQAQPEFLRPLPIRKIPGIGPAAEKQLAEYGVKTIGDFMNLPPTYLKRLGTVVADLYRYCHGHDNRPVSERAPAKQVSAERTFNQDIISLEQMHHIIDHIGQKAIDRLSDRKPRTVTLKIKRHDRSSFTRSHSFPRSINPKDMISIAHHLVQEKDNIAAIRLIGVGFSGFEPNDQEDLFSHPETASSLLPIEILTNYAKTKGLQQPNKPPADTIENTRENHPSDLIIGVQTGAQAITGTGGWITGTDVNHPTYGHGWIQGAGLGKVSVRFETRTSGTGIAKTFPINEPELKPTDPVISLDWDQPWEYSTQKK